MKKLTPEHLEVFKEEVLRWIDKLKLDNWEIHFALKDYENCLAHIAINYEAQICTFCLSPQWSDDIIKLSDEQLKLSAKHEAIELLVAPITFLGAERFLNETEYNAARENVIRKLEKLL